MIPLSTLTTRATHAPLLHPAALASVPYGPVLVRVRVRGVVGRWQPHPGAEVDFGAFLRVLVGYEIRGVQGVQITQDKNRELLIRKVVETYTLLEITDNRE